MSLFKCSRAILLALAGLGSQAAFGNISFTTFTDATITGNATMMSTISAAEAIYSSLYTNNINVVIYFHDTASGLGGSTTTFYTTDYHDVCNAIKASGTSADDAAAATSMGSCGATISQTNPVNGSTSMDFSSADGRALGFATPGGVTDGGHSGLDGSIGLNTSIMNISRSGPQNPSFYDMLAVTLHEMDEVLGTVSGLDGELSNPATEDLFRYNGSGARSYTTSGNAFFSIDGTTNLVQYNNVVGCNAGAGDCGDFVNGDSPVRVQDAFGTPGSQPNLGVEIRMLDVVGYTLADTTPEPGTFVLAGTVLLAAAILRQKSAIRRK